MARRVLTRLLQWNQGDDGVLNEPYDIATLQERSPAPQRAGFRRFTDDRLKGLAIDWDPEKFKVNQKKAKIAHVGHAKFSPTRGTLYVTGVYEGTVKLAVMCSHLLNDPDGSERVGGFFRRLLWLVHMALNRRIARRLLKQGYTVLHGTDINDHTASMNPLVRLLKGRYDAIGYSPKRARLTGPPRTLSPHGSDHRPVIATFYLKETP